MTTPIVEPPDGLTIKARNLWRQVVESERLTPAEMETFDQALRALDRADELAASIAVTGVEVVDRFGITKPNGMLEHEVRSRNQFARLMAKLNLADRDDLDDVPVVEGRMPRFTGTKHRPPWMHWRPTIEAMEAGRTALPRPDDVPLILQMFGRFPDDQIALDLAERLDRMTDRLTDR